MKREDDRAEIERQAIRAAAQAAGVPPSTFEGTMVRAILNVMLADDNRGRMARLLRLVPYEHVSQAANRGNLDGTRYGRVEVANELTVALDNATSDTRPGLQVAVDIALRKYHSG